MSGQKKYWEIEKPKLYSLPNSFVKTYSSTINQKFESSKEYEPDYVKLFFPLLLTTNKLPKKLFIPQPGEYGSSNIYKDSDIDYEPFIWA